MKKRALIAGVLFLLLIISSCANKNTVSQDSKNNSGVNSGVQQAFALKDYFIYSKNTRYIYEGQGNEYA